MDKFEVQFQISLKTYQEETSSDSSVSTFVFIQFSALCNLI